MFYFLSLSPEESTLPSIHSSSQSKIRRLSILFFVVVGRVQKELNYKLVNRYYFRCNALITIIPLTVTIMVMHCVEAEWCFQAGCVVMWGSTARSSGWQGQPRRKVPPTHRRKEYCISSTQWLHSSKANVEEVAKISLAGVGRRRSTVSPSLAITYYWLDPNCCFPSPSSSSAPLLTPYYVWVGRRLWWWRCAIHDSAPCQAGSPFRN